MEGSPDEEPAPKDPAAHFPSTGQATDFPFYTIICFEISSQYLKKSYPLFVRAQLCRISSEVRHATMISIGKQRVLDNYVSVPYSPVYILVNNCFPTHIISKQSIILMAGLGLGPGC